MNLILSGRGVELDEPLRRYATEKLTRVERFFDRIIKMDVEFAREPNRNGAHRVQLTVKTPKDTLRAHGEGSDFFAAVDRASARIEAQVRRFKDRLTRHAHRDTRPPAVPEDDSEEPAILRLRPQASKPLTLDEARLELESRGFAFLFFTDADSMEAAVLYRRADGTLALIEHER